MPPISPGVTEIIQIGNSVRYDGQLCHIRGLVDDYVVFRVWGRHKQRWLYYVKWMYEFQIAYEFGNLQLEYRKMEEE